MKFQTKRALRKQIDELKKRIPLSAVMPDGEGGGIQLQFDAEAGSAYHVGYDIVVDKDGQRWIENSCIQIRYLSGEYVGDPDFKTRWDGAQAMAADNRTNEMIVAEAMVDAGAPLMHSRVEDAVVSALDTADRLVEEPSEAQIEAAVKAFDDHLPLTSGALSSSGTFWCGECHKNTGNRIEAREHALRKALEAAQGAAPESATELAQAKADLKTVGEVSRATFDKLKAERDAARAAIERVRDLASSLRGRYAENSDAAYFTSQFLAALDGAPEPEWEWAVRAPGDDEPFSDIYQTREHLADQETGIAWGEEQMVRRRKAGPWLPVEGEKP